MFHTYVRNSLGKPISLERAEHLMDSRIVHRVLTEDGCSPEKSPQDFFDRYCTRHQAKHSKEFPPAVAEAF